ncbi:ankyrin repeat domain-containing protein [Legionella feeleii]|uniref:Ankyrin repeats (3 copies) n=1 Tax=Legionella feeleii TaxID=453 RepID=A0A0W0TJM1_9GAMM|nr:ankyrin repeat domain-containing protein [Legionella feeleii]KTC95381.1 Ankyrin repeats (3 copies) [Legionella feeleii]SPX61126.1 Ankyrin repeats (3 copies) [Legionella feeleii]
MKTIFQAVIDGDLDEIRKLRAQGQIDINALNEQGDSALTIAIKKRNLAAFRLLLDFKGLDLNQETYTSKFENKPYPSTPLLWSTKLNQPDMVKELLAKGADPAKQLGYFKVTPLMFAVSNDFLACVKLLIETGKGVDLKNARGTTALDLAAQEGKSAALKLLVPHVTHGELLTAANLADQNKHPEIAQLLRNWTSPTSEQKNQSTSSQAVPKVRAQKLIDKSTSPDKHYNTLIKTVKTLEEKFKAQEEVVKILQEELKAVKEAQQLLTTTAQPVPDLVQATTEAMHALGPILRATAGKVEPAPVTEASIAGRIPPDPGMIQPVSTIQPMTANILKPTPGRLQSTTSSAQPALSTGPLLNPGDARPQISNHTRSSFFALANRPLPHNELSNPANYALTPSQSKPN